MNPKCPITQRKWAMARKLLVEDGVPVAKVVERGILSRRACYDLVRREKLPTNRPVRKGSPLEHQIYLAYSLGYTLGEIGKLFKIAQKPLRSILRSAHERLQQTDLGDRLPRKVPPPISKAPCRSRSGISASSWRKQHGSASHRSKKAGHR